MTANGGINYKSPLPYEEHILREVGSAAQAGWGVMTAPVWSSYPGRDLGKGKRHLVLISELANCGNYYFSERPRSPAPASGTIRASVAKRSQHGA